MIKNKPPPYIMRPKGKETGVTRAGMSYVNSDDAGNFLSKGDGARVLPHGTR